MIVRMRRWDPEKDDAATLWSRLNDGWRDIFTSINGLLPFSLREQTFDVGSPSRPRAVILASLYRTDTGATSAVTFSWSYANGEVTTTAFSALASAEWKATFLVISGAL